MGFFDLNIPDLESDRHATDNATLKGRRLKLALKSMELGYTGVAYNRTLKGVMSESHRCSTALFPLSKLTPSSTSFFAAVKFHRDLLNVAVSTPFRQYTRLTVIVDIPSQASALNARNPILRSYDIVAVRPMNQNAFDQACQTSEVDMIAIDFVEKLPFRLKQPMVKAAIKRGVYFEITYSGLIVDAQSRRQMISNCKNPICTALCINNIQMQVCAVPGFSSIAVINNPNMSSYSVSITTMLTVNLNVEAGYHGAISFSLFFHVANLLVDWTRGKNLIFSSAAPSATELRGPLDVANLFSLLGLPMERAKAAISKNCRHAILLKLYVTVDCTYLSSEIAKYPLPPLFNIYQKKKKIASGIGVILLFHFSNGIYCFLVRSLLANVLRKKHFYKEAVKVEKIPSGEQAKPDQSVFDDWLKYDPISSGEGDLLLDDMEKSFSSSNTINKTAKTINFTSTMNGLPAHGLQIKDLISVTKAAIEPPDVGNFACTAMETEEADAISKKPEEQNGLNYTGTYTNFEDTISISSQKHNYSKELEENLVASETQFTQSQIYEENSLPDDRRVHRTTIEAECTPIFDNHASIEIFDSLNKSSFSGLQLQGPHLENRCDEGICAQEGAELDGIPNEIENEDNEGPSLASSDISSQDINVGAEQNRETTNLPVGEIIGEPMSEDEMGEEKLMEHISGYQALRKSLAAKRRKQNLSHQSLLHPFKRFLKPRSSSRKARKLKPLRM
ncbi:hypothetical protein BUALT_Bualt02G0054900 [Buddleja alternifolia]|uniref:Uncharacterized protein n=1 Tax=Buddleja alternifolia TaxID=168488 RepID=A0AAV6XXT2_9LAMI|nr:hypothetical protein BUALT_Bualt02G0054900 [Buddleja alternifolia]